MPHFTVMIGSDGPTIDLAVAVARAWQRQLATQGTSAPSPNTVRALIDTGSDLSVVHPQVLQQLGVQATGSVRVRRPGAGGGFRLAAMFDIESLNRRRQSRHALDFDTGGRRGPIHADGPGIDRPGCAGALHAVLQRAAGRADSLLLSRAIAPDLADRGRKEC